MSSTIDPNTDPYGNMGLIRNPDSSITRIPGFFPTTPASSDPANPILTKDIPINEENKTWARIYLPKPESDATPATKLPLIVYYHGGGFVIASAASTFFQKFCSGITEYTSAVMVSVDYRLAPEHRLPAAFDDCMEALHWIKTTDEEWLIKYADFSKCFVMGNSAGGNIAYRVGLHAVACVDQLMPLKIQGLILHQPFFGGVERTPSEIRLANDKVVPPHVNDIVWDLALPIGVNRDHEYSNPMMDIKIELVDKVRKEGWKILVTGYKGDPLVDRQIELVKMLKEKGVDVMEEFSDGGCHGIEFYDDSKANIYYGVLKKFLLTF